MCGIAGVVWKDPQRPAARQAVRVMADAIAHRGPDDEGFFTDGPVALGHRRLSIIDLSPGGHQPMISRDGRLVIVYNGEIYNYLELRDELRREGHQFSTDSDTEVILAAYERWGPDCVTRFNGMWALALLDRRQRTLLLSRDRLGIKPLYYLLNDECLAFASEIKAILAAMPEHRRVNASMIQRFMPGGMLCDGPETFFRDIVSLPQAHNAIYDISAGTLTLRRYWQAEPEQFAAQWAGHDPVEALRELLDSAVRLHMRSDVPVGTCLSGGVDSSTIVGLMSLLRDPSSPVRTFSGLYPDRDCDEREYVDAVNERCRCVPCPVHPEPVDGHDLLDDLARITWHQDMPSAGPGLYTQYHVMRRACSDVKVILDGQGGDELFAGYLPYFADHLQDLWSQGIAGRAKAASLILAIWRHWGVQQAGLSAQRILSPGLTRTLRRLVGRRPESAQENQPPIFSPEFGAQRPEHTSPVAQHSSLGTVLQRHIVSDSLPALLHYEDRNSMAWSIEARVPLLDYRIVEFALGLDSRWKINGSWTKWVLRKAAEDVLPRKVAWRRSKLGYPTPFARWLRQDGTRRSIEDLLLGREFRSRGVINDQAVRFWWDQHQSGAADHSWMLWRCITLEQWHRQFVDAPQAPSTAAPGAQRSTRGLAAV